MKLTLKCLIDFRSWLNENYDMNINEFNDLPEFIQDAYILEFLNVTKKSNNSVIMMYNEIYNEKFA